MSTRHAWAALALLVMVAPVLAFPAVLGSANGWMAALVAIVALAGAITVVGERDRLVWPVGLLAFTALVGWSRAGDQASSLSHFCGLALGLLAMGTVAAWCNTRNRFILATVAFLLCGAIALSVGNRSTTPVHKSKALFGETSAVRGAQIPLPLSGLHARESVNRNALAATAMMILTVAGAVALAPARRFSLRMPLRVAGVLSAAWAAAVVIMMQSRSAWLSAGVIAWILARRLMRPRSWWLITGGLCLVLTAMALLILWSDHPRAAEAVTAVHARLAIWGQALQALQWSPWIGIGLDYFRHSGYSPVLVYPDMIVGRPHAHNIFLQTALDVGLFGLAGYLAIMWFVLRRAVGLARGVGGDAWVRSVAVGAALSVVSVHVYGLLDAVPLGAKVGIFQWWACGLILAAWRMRTPSEGT